VSDCINVNKSQGHRLAGSGVRVKVMVSKNGKAVGLISIFNRRQFVFQSVYSNVINHLTASQQVSAVAN